MTKVQRGPLVPTAFLVDNLWVGAGTAPFPGVALADGPSPILEVSIQCDPDSPASLFVGNVFGQFREVTAGSVEVIPARDLNTVHIMSPGANATYNWMAGI